MYHADRKDDALANAIRSSAIEFMRVELKIGNTMLDLAAATSDRETYARRRAQAIEACNTVKRHLDEPAVPLPGEETNSIGAGLHALQSRIRAAPLNVGG
ncbi:MAG: hypothetical protein M3Z10_14025 [Gemmatimonadota bacterium]|nr:hypothetical protein [Gemmatimonadota bacterium]